MDEGEVREQEAHDRKMDRAAQRIKDSSVLQDDLRDMCLALGLHNVARPQSPHEVFRECISEVERMRAALPSRVEREEIENMRGDYEAGRKIFASSAAVALRVIDRFIDACT